MKLKKIASLALAGIMAVSMLAGCKEAATATAVLPATPTTSLLLAMLQFRLDKDAQIKLLYRDTKLQAVALANNAGCDAVLLTE